MGLQINSNPSNIFILDGSLISVEIISHTVTLAESIAAQFIISVDYDNKTLFISAGGYINATTVYRNYSITTSGANDLKIAGTMAENEIIYISVMKKL
jgi:hypothetical protein